MLIKKNKYIYKLTLYSTDKNSKIKPLIFKEKKNNVEIILSQNISETLGFYNNPINISSYSSKYEIKIHNIREDIEARLYKLFKIQNQNNYDIQWGTIQEHFNLEVKKGSEKIIFYNALLINSESISIGFNIDVDRSITFIGEYANYIYNC